MFAQNIAKCRQINQNEVIGRSCHTASLIKGIIYFFGGHHRILQDSCNELILYHIASNTWEYIKPAKDWPPPRSSHTAVVYKDNIFVYGGVSESAKNDVNHNDCWKLDTHEMKWKQIEIIRNFEDSCPHLDSHIAVVYKNYMYLYSGFDEFSDEIQLYDNVLYRLNLETNQFDKILSTGQIPMRRHRATGLVYENSLFVFGGVAEMMRVQLNDLFKYDFISNTWTEITQISPPTQRRSHNAVIYKNHMIVFGGFDGVVCNNELWKYNFMENKWTQFEVHGTLASKRGVFSFTVHNHSIFLFGGNDDDIFFDDFYEFLLDYFEIPFQQKIFKNVKFTNVEFILD